MQRRDNSAGTIRERFPGHWEGAIRIEGRRYWIRGKSRAEVGRKLGALKRDHAAGELVPSSRITLAEHMADWTEANRGTWRPSTLAGYEGIARNYILPAFGHRRLQTVTAADIARQYQRWRDEGVGARTLAIIHARLHRALRVAVWWGRMGRNPCDGVEPPRSVSRRPSMWEPSEAWGFVASLTGESWGEALGAVLVGGGLRLGEACGLRWEDLDPDTGVLRVTRTRMCLRGEWIEHAPKTRAGTRAVTLPSFAVATLRRWRAVQAEQRLRLGAAWAGEDRMVTLPEGVTPKRWKAGEWLKSHCQSLGLMPLRPHDLRHLSASLALSEGVALVDVSRRLGHANTNVTAAIYAHALRPNDGHIARAMDTAFSAGGA
jgi:integrase